MAEIMESKDFDYDDCQEAIGQYLNLYLCIVRTSSKLTYYMRMANGHLPLNNMWVAYPSDTELLKIGAGATKDLWKEGANDKRVKVETNPIRLWLKWPRRNTFDRITFHPVDHTNMALDNDLLCPLDEFNLYKGPGITRKQAFQYAERVGIEQVKREYAPWENHVIEVSQSYLTCACRRSTAVRRSQQNTRLTGSHMRCNCRGRNPGQCYGVPAIKELGRA